MAWLVVSAWLAALRKLPSAAKVMAPVPAAVAVKLPLKVMSPPFSVWAKTEPALPPPTTRSFLSTKLTTPALVKFTRLKSLAVLVPVTLPAPVSKVKVLPVASTMPLNSTLPPVVRMTVLAPRLTLLM